MKPVDLSNEDYQSMVVLFQNETDRGAAVLAGSYVENYLGLYLKSKMSDTSVADKVFGQDGSLSTFHQRIYFAQAFGFLSKAQCADLLLIKKIRNHFAHHPKEASFASKPVSDWVEKLHSALIPIRMPDGTDSKIDDPRICYLLSSGMFIALNILTN